MTDAAGISGNTNSIPNRSVLMRRGTHLKSRTTGLLQFKGGISTFDLIRYIGKESNRLEEVDAGLIHSEHGVYTEYPDPRRDEWQLKILPKLTRIPVSGLLKESGMSRSALFEVLAGRSRPHSKNRARLAEVVKKLELI
jgi:hypothetical protein